MHAWLQRLDRHVPVRYTVWLACAVLALLATFSWIAFGVGGWLALLGLFGVTYFGWLPLFLPELFPTHVRSTGTGISFNTGRVIAACVVLLTAFRMDLFEGDYAQVGMWSGLIYVVGMIIIWFAPQKTELTAEAGR